MTNEDKAKGHTPTPWTQENKHGKFSQYVLGQDGRVVAACTMRVPLEADDNAAFIIEAVNAYDSLKRENEYLKAILIKTKKLPPEPGTTVKWSDLAKSLPQTERGQSGKEGV